MKIDIDRMGSVTVLSPRSAISQDDVQDFVNTVEDSLQSSNGRLVLEFSQVTFMDSQGVEALWDLVDRQREAGQSAKIAAVPEICREIFELTGIGEQIDMFDSAESAVRSFI